VSSVFSIASLSVKFVKAYLGKTLVGSNRNEERIWFTKGE